MKGFVPLALEGCKADIYALGVIFYQLINGKAADYINDQTVKLLKARTSNQLHIDFADLLESMLVEVQGQVYDYV